MCASEEEKGAEEAKRNCLSVYEFFGFVNLEKVGFAGLAVNDNVLNERKIGKIALQNERHTLACTNVPACANI